MEQDEQVNIKSLKLWRMVGKKLWSFWIVCLKGSSEISRCCRNAQNPITSHHIAQSTLFFFFLPFSLNWKEAIRAFQSKQWLIINFSCSRLFDRIHLFMSSNVQTRSVEKKVSIEGHLFQLMILENTLLLTQSELMEPVLPKVRIIHDSFSHHMCRCTSLSDLIKDTQLIIERKDRR